MAILPIRIYGDPVLRKKSEPVTEITPELRQLAKDMLETMYDAPGCGLAAPQIGKNIRLVVIDTAIPGEEDPKPYVMFNPEYKVDVLKILIAARKRKRYSVIWPGRLEDGKLIYAEEGYPDYKVFNIADYDITCVR